MGKKSGASSKAQARGASAVAEPPTLPDLAVGSTVAADAPGELDTLDQRQQVRADIVSALLAGVTDTEAKALATAAKVINDYERAELRREEDALDVRVASELNKIERTRAQKRSGVVREDEAPQLPLAESQRTH